MNNFLSLLNKFLFHVYYLFGIGAIIGSVYAGSILNSYMIIVLVFFFFSFIHWKLAKIFTALSQELFFIIFSSINLLIILFGILISYNSPGSEGAGLTITFVLFPILTISTITSFVFGVESAFTESERFKLNKIFKLLFAFILFILILSVGIMGLLI